MSHNNTKTRKNKDMDTNDILTKANHSDGMTVPEGFFADFNKKMAASLPPIDYENTEKPKVLPQTFWQKVRPYVYLAAMFAGIWCMMNMFDLMRPANADLSIDNQAAITAAVNNEDFYNTFVAPSMDEDDLYEDLYTQGFDSSEFDYE